MGREAPLKLTSADMPIDLAAEVEAVLEVDKLFWLDTKNKNTREYERRFVPGEELPKKLPINTNERTHTRVFVQRWGRTFVVAGKPVLLIEDNAPKVALPKAEKDHKIGDALVEFRIFMAEFNKQVRLEREKRLAVRPSLEARRAQSEADKAKMLDLRAAKRAKREAVSAAKRRDRNDSGDTARGDATLQPAT